jgi:hypothetical protein
MPGKPSLAQRLHFWSNETEVSANGEVAQSLPHCSEQLSSWPVHHWPLIAVVSSPEPPSTPRNRGNGRCAACQLFRMRRGTAVAHQSYPEAAMTSQR